MDLWDLQDQSEIREIQGTQVLQGIQASLGRRARLDSLVWQDLKD